MQVLILPLLLQLLLVLVLSTAAGPGDISRVLTCRACGSCRTAHGMHPAVLCNTIRCSSPSLLGQALQPWHKLHQKPQGSR